MADYTKVKRSQFATYLDITPEATATYKLLGVGITEYGIAFNPQVDTEKWIIEDNARNDHTSNQKQGSVSQTIHLGDDCFEFVRSGMDQLNYKTNILDIDLYKGVGGVYPAKLSAGIVAITNYMGENATIEYDLYYNGDAVDGTVTITGGVPTFTSGTSL
jgi:hypothetical protein